MSHHLFPWTRCRRTMFISSSSVHFFLLMFGSKWLCQRSRHCLPMRPGRLFDTLVQLRGPFSVTSYTRILSSSFVQVPVTQLLTLFSSSHRVWHLISDLPGISLLILFHELLPNWLTHINSFSSYTNCKIR